MVDRSTSFTGRPAALMMSAMKRSSSPLVSSVPATATNGSLRPPTLRPTLRSDAAIAAATGMRVRVCAAPSIRAAATSALQRVGSTGFDR